MGKSGEEVLKSFGYSIRLAIGQSLLAVRGALPAVVDLWKLCRLCRVGHCFACPLNKRGWIFCIQQEEGVCCCSGVKIGRADACNCRHLKACGGDDIPPSLPSDVFTMLGREDFILNYVGSAVVGSDSSHSPHDVEQLRRFNGKKSENIDDVLSAFPHLSRSYEGIFASEEKEIGDFQIDRRNGIDTGGFESSSGAYSDKSNPARSFGEDLDGLLRVEKLSVSRFAEDERMHEVDRGFMICLFACLFAIVFLELFLPQYQACRLLRSSRLHYLKVERLLRYVKYEGADKIRVSM